MKSNRSVPTDAVLPHITYRDVEEAIAWLSAAFGFLEHYRYGRPVTGAQMRAGKAWVMLKRAQGQERTPRLLGFGTQSLTVFIEDIEAHFARAKSFAVTVHEDLHETAYGELQYAAADLDGHHWLFARHARDLGPDEWGATVAGPTAVRSTLTPKISPVLPVRNARQAVEFYIAAFEAEVLFLWDNGGAAAELSAGGSKFWVAEEPPGNLNFSPESPGGGTVRLVMTVEDPDAAFARTLAAGAKPRCAVADQPCGRRVGRLVDPFGHHWEIAKPL